MAREFLNFATSIITCVGINTTFNYCLVSPAQYQVNYLVAPYSVPERIFTGHHAAVLATPGLGGPCRLKHLQETRRTSAQSPRWAPGRQKSPDTWTGKAPPEHRQASTEIAPDITRSMQPFCLWPLPPSVPPLADCRDGALIAIIRM